MSAHHVEVMVMMVKSRADGGGDDGDVFSS